ncbi:response regulator [Leptolyngbya sp. FACHB-36]|nr:response regulator [Leptolyngbya sp. FACHB-36]
MILALPSRANSSTNILLIEDNDISRQLMSEYLKYCGYNVLELPGGSAFETSIAAFQPDLILLDLKLPDVDGFTLLQQVQQHPEWLHIPIIVVSAFAFQSDQQRALSLGARRYLVKPVKLVQLERSIQEELAQ